MAKTCKTPRCPRTDIRRKGLCETCSYRMETYGDVSLFLNQKNPKCCTIDGCPDDAITRGWCKKHYRTWERNGHPEKMIYEMHHTGCRVKRCPEKHKKKGFCDKHSKQAERGTLTAPLKKVKKSV